MSFAVGVVVKEPIHALGEGLPTADGILVGAVGLEPTTS